MPTSNTRRTSGQPRGPYSLQRIDTGEKVARKLPLELARAGARAWNTANESRRWVVIVPAVGSIGGAA